MSRLITLLAVPLFLLSCRHSSPSEPPIQEPVQQSPQILSNPRGQELYQSRCASCHGDDGRGEYALVGGIWGDGPSWNMLRMFAEGLNSNSPHFGRMWILTPDEGDALSVEDAMHVHSYIVQDLAKAAPVLSTMDFVTYACEKDFMHREVRPKSIHWEKVQAERDELERTLACSEDTMSEVFAPYQNPTAEMLARGSEVYNANCGACHGDQGFGNGPAAPALVPRPTNFRDLNAWKHGKSVPEVFWVLQHGIEGTSMASYSNLSVSQQLELVSYIRQWFPTEVATEPLSEDAVKKGLSQCLETKTATALERDPCALYGVPRGTPD